MQNYSLGGNHLFGNLKFNWMGAFAKASEERLNERYLEYESELQINSRVDSEFPLFTSVNASDLDSINFEFGELTEENQYTEEEDVNFFANFELHSDMFGNGEGTIKFGVKGRFKNKNRDNDFYEFSPESSAFDIMSSVPTRDFTKDDYAVGSQYQAGFFADPAYLGSLDLFNESQFESELLQEEFVTANFDVKENVFAGYVMTNQKLSDKLSVLAGLRLESTKIESTGYEINFDEDGDITGTNELNGENTYANFLPGLHFKYDATDKTVLRFAWTNTLARPNYVDLVPFAEINNEDEEIVLGNADLNPATSMNFDVMAEHYFKSIGIVSGGLFYKNIKDFSYTFVSENDEGYDVFQPLNGDKANVFGAEIAFQKQFANHFGVYLNYTYLSSEAKGIRNEDGDERGDLDLPGATPNMFNGSLSYSNEKFSARISGNFSDAYLDELGGNDFEDRYYDTQFFLDFNASYSINENLTFYADLNNITNQPLRYYQGVSSRTMQLEYYRQRLTFGLKYDLFKKK